MILINISDHILSGMGSDGRYYEFEPGYSGPMPDELVRRQGWISKGAVVRDNPVKEQKTKPKKKDKKIDTDTDSMLDELY